MPTANHRSCDLAYRVTGDGPPILFIQGVGVHGDGWRPQIDALSSRFTCIAFDNRGVGRSRQTGGALSVELMAEDARTVLDAAGFEMAHVVGHSLGGLVALTLALEHRARVASLSLLCTFARGRDAAPMTPRMIWTGMRTRIGSRAMRRRAFLELVMPPGALRDADTGALASQLEPLFGHDLGLQPPIVSAQLAAMRRCDPSSRLGELAGLSALVVSAEHDPIAPPAAGRRLAGLLPCARHVELPDASHGVPIEQPAVINRLLGEHFNGVAIHRIS